MEQGSVHQSSEGEENQPEKCQEEAVDFNPQGYNKLGDPPEFVINNFSHRKVTYNKFCAPNYLNIGLNILTLVDLSEFEAILEAGCGAGHLALEIV